MKGLSVLLGCLLVVGVVTGASGQCGRTRGGVSTKQIEQMEEQLQKAAVPSAQATDQTKTTK